MTSPMENQLVVRSPFAICYNWPLGRSMMTPGQKVVTAHNLRWSVLRMLEISGLTLMRICGRRATIATIFLIYLFPHRH